MVLLLFLCFISVNWDCSLFENEDPPLVHEPYEQIKSKKDIIGEWICFHTWRRWRHGSEKFYLDMYYEEDRLIIDSGRVQWEGYINNDLYKYNFPYVLDTVESWFCKDTLRSFSLPIHHSSYIFGDIGVSSGQHYWVQIHRLHDTLRITFDSWYNSYDHEIAYYVLKIW